MSYLEDLKEISFKFKPKQMAALPGITKKDREVVKFSGVDFYTNENLRQKFIMSLMKHTPVKVHTTIEKLVEKKIIIPAFLTKSTFSWYVKNKLDPEQDDKMSGVRGFYIPKEKKIFVLIDAGYKVLGWVPDQYLAGVTLHECMHMAAKKDPKKFLQVNIKPLYDYYSTFLDYVFITNKNIDKADVVKWITYLYGFETRKNGLASGEYGTLIDKAVKSHTQLEHKEMVNRIIHIIKYTFGTYGANGSKLMNIIREQSNVYRALMTSYIKAFGFRPRTLAYQELFTPSEVICILATMELGKNRYVSDTLDILL